MPSRRPTAPRGSRRTTGAPPAPGSGGAQRATSRRPGAAARARTPRTTGPETPRGLTRRAAVLGVLALVAAIAVAPYLRSVAAQQADIAALEAEVAEREQAVTELEAQLERWRDPAFVKARARERLFMVMPGETGYVVLDPPSEKEMALSDPAAVAEAASTPGRSRPWFGTLWESVQLAGAATPAGQPGPEPSPAPAAP